MPVKSLSAGDYIAARCTRCKDDTNHTIVALVGEKVVKVECNTCGNKHNYHQLKMPKAPASRKAPAAANKPRVTKSQRAWEELLATTRPEEAIPYSISTPMRDGLLIRHPSFGLGQVISISKLTD